jgi:hypothetical protein
MIDESLDSACAPGASPLELPSELLVAATRARKPRHDAMRVEAMRVEAWRASWLSRLSELLVGKG